MKEKLKALQIHNVEGNNEFCTFTFEKNIWGKVQEKVNEWSDFLQDKGYSKIDVVFFWENTEFYFRFDFTKQNCDLKKALLNELNFYIKCPNDIDNKNWRGYIHSFNKINPEYLEKMKHIINNCEI